MPVIRRRHRSAGRNKQNIPGCSEVSLGGDTAESEGTVRQFIQEVAARVITPYLCPCLGVQRIDVDSQRGPHPRSNVRDVVRNKYAGAKRPTRNHSTVAQYLIVEAATGTGKTMAYLVPALASKKRVVITTGTKALQDQLFHKDIPLLAELWPEEIRAVLLKGRKNYLCKLRFDSFKASPSFRARGDLKHWSKVRSWASKTETGDRAEINGLPDDYATWNDLSVGAEACLGTNCQFYKECHVTIARGAASTAQVVVINHHLFFADLAVKEGGFAAILPDYDAVIFDEAHHLESVATSYFGRQVSNYRIRELIGDIERVLDDEKVDADDVRDALIDLDKAQKEFFSFMTFGKYDGRYLLAEVLEGAIAADIADARQKTNTAFEHLQKTIARVPKLGEISERLVGRSAEVRHDFDQILRADDDRYVYFFEIRDRGYFLQASPIDLAELLRKRLLDKQDTMIFTSATLATGGSFDYFKQRMGMTAGGELDTPREEFPIRELILPAVFDYPEQCLLYVPKRMPDPRAESFTDDCTTVIKYLLEQSRGRAFVLFTSYNNLNIVHGNLVDELDYTVLKQGERPRNELLEEFRADSSSVLFATSSFWEGVDVEGEALSMVIIDKLPFGNPSDPLTAARHRLLEARGKNPFMEFTVPEAALSLKQGFGRLIRSRSDVGVVAILDSRLAHKRYGDYFLKSLPPAPVVWRAAEVRDWWAERIGDEEE